MRPESGNLYITHFRFCGWRHLCAHKYVTYCQKRPSDGLRYTLHGKFGTVGMHVFLDMLVYRQASAPLPAEYSKIKSGRSFRDIRFWWTCLVAIFSGGKFKTQFNPTGQLSKVRVPKYNQNGGPIPDGMILPQLISIRSIHVEISLAHLTDHTCGSWTAYIDNVEPQKRTIRWKKEGKVLPYSLPSVGPGADPNVQTVSPHRRTLWMVEQDNYNLAVCDSVNRFKWD